MNTWMWRWFIYAGAPRERPGGTAFTLLSTTMSTCRQGLSDPSCPSIHRCVWAEEEMRVGRTKLMEVVTEEEDDDGGGGDDDDDHDGEVCG